MYQNDAFEKEKTGTTKEKAGKRKKEHKTDTYSGINDSLWLI